jgi:hypothetical protein
VPLTRGLALAFVAAPALAEGGPSAEAVARFIQAVEVAGCQVTELNRKTVLAEAEMDETEAEVIVSVLVQRGEGQLGDGTFTLKTGPCKG